MDPQLCLWYDRHETNGSGLLLDAMRHFTYPPFVELAKMLLSTVLAERDRLEAWILSEAMILQEGNTGTAGVGDGGAPL